MELFTLKKINTLKNTEEFLCISADTELSGYDSCFLRYDFEFVSEEDMKKYESNLYVTANKEEFENKSIPKMDDEDKTYIFETLEEVKLEIVKITLNDVGA